MANWTIIDEAAVRTGKIAVFIDAMKARAAAGTESDPLPEMIADVVATIRAALSTGNTLDADAGKVPNSLKGLSLRLINRRVKGYLDRELTTEESKQADDDRSYLNRIMDQKIRFETPDDPAGTAEMQGGGRIEVGDQVNSQTQSTRVAKRDRLGGLLVLLVTCHLSLVTLASGQTTFSRINSLPVRNVPTATDMIAAETAAGQTVRIPFDKFTGGGGGTGDAMTSGTLAQFAPTTSLELKGVLTNELGDAAGKAIFALGTLNIATGKVFTANNTITMTGADGATANVGAGLSIATGKTFTANNSVTVSATDGAILNFGAGLTIAAGKTLTVNHSMILASDNLATRTLNIGTGGTLQTVAYSGFAGDMTGLESVVEFTTPTVYSAGAKQSFSSSYTTAGRRDIPLWGVDPSAGVIGDWHYRSDIDRPRFYTLFGGWKTVATTEDTGSGSSEQTIGNVDGAWTNGKTTLRQTTLLTANRTSTLPAANTFPPGAEILYYDSVSSSTSAFGRSFTPAGFNTLNGGVAPYTPFAGNGTARFATDGVSAWTSINQRQSILSLQDPTDPTKQASFSLLGLPTETTRVINVAGTGDSTTVVPATGTSLQYVHGINADGTLDFGTPSGSGSGSVTTFSAGTLSPIFTTSVTNPTTTPALSFALTAAGAYTFFGNPTGASAVPQFATALQTRTALEVAQKLTPTAVRTANYTAGLNEIIPADISAGSFVISLPNAPADGTREAIKLVAVGGTNVLTIACQGADVLNKTGGSTSTTLSLLGQAVTLQYRSAGGIWYVVTNDAPLSTYDARYFHARVTSITSSATPTVNTDNTDAVNITALATNITSMSSALTGTPSPFDQLIYRIKDDGTPRSIVWGASFIARGGTLPVTTVAGKVTYVLLIWNSVSATWDCVSVAQES